MRDPDRERDQNNLIDGCCVSHPIPSVDRFCFQVGWRDPSNHAVIIIDVYFCFLFGCNYINKQSQV